MGNMEKQEEPNHDKQLATVKTIYIARADQINPTRGRQKKLRKTWLSDGLQGMLCNSPST